MTPPKILPPHYFLFSLIGMVALGLVDTTVILPAPWQWTGGLPILVGIWLAAQGSRGFSRAGTGIVPFSESTALVTDGVFSFSRNPMYTGMVLALIGTAVLLNGFLAWLVIVPFLAVIRLYFISNEEQLMEQTFGEQYLSYKSAVRRWL